MSKPTARELEVLAAVRRLRSRKCAAAELGITDLTAAVHLKHLYRKLGARCSDDAARALGIPQD